MKPNFYGFGKALLAAHIDIGKRDTALTYDYLRDLVVDIRCARRDRLDEYAAKQTTEFRRLWSTRRETRITKYGVPEPR